VQHAYPAVNFAVGLISTLAVHGAVPTQAYAETSSAAQPVTTTAVLQSDLPVEISAVGNVQPLKTVTVRPQVAGQLLSLDFNEGQTVQSGQQLARIDPRLYQAAVDQDTATVAKDRAYLGNATIDLRRYGPLSTKGLVSNQELESQQARVDQLKAQLSADQAILDRDQVQLGFTSITSPIQGVAGLNLVDAGNVVSPSDTSGIVLVTQVEPIAVLFPVPQTELLQIQLDLQAAGASGLTVEAWSQGDSRKLETGSLIAINNHINTTSGTVMLKASFLNQKHLLWPGEFVNIRLVLHVQRDALSVPIDALQVGPAGSFVWAVDPLGKAQQVNVLVEQTSNGRAIIGSGLRAGQQVVTNGQYALVAGRDVIIQKSGAGGNNTLPLRNNHDDVLGIVP
jgi:multidrug efflux system membrane fusion protein